MTRFGFNPKFELSRVTRTGLQRNGQPPLASLGLAYHIVVHAEDKFTYNYITNEVHKSYVSLRCSNRCTKKNNKPNCLAVLNVKPLHEAIKV